MKSIHGQANRFMREIDSPIPTDNIDFTKTVGTYFPESAPIAVVVMSTNSDHRTLRAVRSVLEQDFEAQVVVVNTGRGTLEAWLAPVIDHIMLIETAQRQFPGGTRNLGIKHSSAPIVSFLAADCVAEKHWLSKRLRHHNEHPAVSSSVEPMPSASGQVRFISKCAHLAVHRHRLANSGREYRVHYGLSYARALFLEYGLFDETVRVGEDTLLNARLEAHRKVFHATDITTSHEYPDTIFSTIADQIRRGRRRGRFARAHNSAPARIFFAEIKRTINWYILDIFRDPALRKRGAHVIACSAMLTLASACASLFPSDADI